MNGTLEAVRDCGSVVQMFIRDEDGDLVVAAGDGNLTRAALADSGIEAGDAIEFDIEDWGGLAWFAPA